MSRLAPSMMGVEGGLHHTPTLGQGLVSPPATLGLDLLSSFLTHHFGPGLIPPSPHIVSGLVLSRCFGHRPAYPTPLPRTGEREGDLAHGSSWQWVAGISGGWWAAVHCRQ